MAQEPEEKDVDEGPSDEDLKELDSEETDTRRCPKCGREVYEDADRCPQCGQWITVEEGKAKRGLAGVVLAIIILGLVAVLVVIFAFPPGSQPTGPGAAPTSQPASAHN